MSNHLCRRVSSPFYDRSVVSKHPLALVIHGPKNGGGRLHRDGYMYVLGTLKHVFHTSLMSTRYKCTCTLCAYCHVHVTVWSAVVMVGQWYLAFARCVTTTMHNTEDTSIEYMLPRIIMACDGLGMRLANGPPTQLVVWAISYTIWLCTHT